PGDIDESLICGKHCLIRGIREGSMNRLAGGILADRSVISEDADHIVGAEPSDTDNGLRMRDGQCPEQEAVDCSKQRRIRTNPQRECENRYCRESGHPAERANSMSSIARELFKHAGHSTRGFCALKSSNARRRRA